VIETVKSKLAELGLLDGGKPVRCNVFVKLDNVLMDVFEAGGRYLYVRVAETYDLEAEARIAYDVSGRLGGLVPRPLAFFRVDGLSCIVFEGVEFQVVTGGDLLTTRPNESLGRNLLHFLATVHRSLRTTSPDVTQVIAETDARFAGTEHQDLWAEVARGIDVGHLAALPGLLQHGDFVPNNLGIRRDGIVVFDWEDFGKVCLPGFDLAVLLASLVDFEPTELREMRDATSTGGAGGVEWLPAALHALELDPRQFWHDVPFHLFLFLGLKDRYSAAIRAKVARAIEGVLR
jgi:hypothetical protein